jgi:predicted nucleotidyltransferase
MSDQAHLSQIRIALPMEQITAFCQRWGIAELALFGSVLRGEIRSDSDVDVLVTFAEPDILPDRQIMKQELERIFGRKVDLVYRRVIERSENYLLRNSILRSARVIYAT